MPGSGASTARVVSTSATFAVDERLEVVGWSPECRSLSGLSPEEVVGRPCYEVLSACSPEFRCGPDCALAAAAFRGETPSRPRVAVPWIPGRLADLETTVVLHKQCRILLHTVRPVGASFELAHGLTPREAVVLSLLASGHGTREIARTLVISPATVRNHVQSILRKLGVHSRLEAVALVNSWEPSDGPGSSDPPRIEPTISPP